MKTEHNYKLLAVTTGKRIVSLRIDGMDEVEVTSAPDWWPEAPSGMFSPQTLFVSASASCIILSLYKVAEKMHISFKDASVEAVGEMDEVNGVWQFSKITLYVDITIDDESVKDKIGKALKKAHDFCPVRNSLSIPSILEYTVRVE